MTSLVKFKTTVHQTRSLNLKTDDSPRVSTKFKKTAFRYFALLKLNKLQTLKLESLIPLDGDLKYFILRDVCYCF